jgi:hypothetical protein
MKQELKDFLSLVRNECPMHFRRRHHTAIQELLDNYSSQSVLLAILILFECADTTPKIVHFCDTFVAERHRLMEFIKAIYHAGLVDVDRITDVWIGWDEDADMSLFSDLLKPDGAARLTESRAELSATV